MLPLLSLLKDPPARAPLGAFPSPVESHPELASELGAVSLLIKRDDLNGAGFGGNKLRALEFLLPAAGPVVVTMGGYGSTWCAALVRSAPATRARVHLALFPQPWTETVAGLLNGTLEAASVRLAQSRLGLPGAVLHAWRAARRDGAPRWLPAGGAAPLAVLGSLNALLEFAAQLETSATPPPDAIVVPLGSGGTAAGLVLGCWLARWTTEVCAVRVTDPWFANALRVRALMRHTLRLLRRCGLGLTPGVARLRVVPDQLGGGYGHSTPAALAARDRFAKAHLRLDTTYGAKAAAALASLAPSFPRLCFWHTFDARLVTAEPAEHPLLRQARTNAESLWPLPKSI